LLFFLLLWCIFFHLHLFHPSASFSLTRGVFPMRIRSPTPLTDCLPVCCTACIVTALLKLLALNVLLKTGLKERSPYVPECAPRCSCDSTGCTSNQGAWEKNLNTLLLSMPMDQSAFLSSDKPYLLFLMISLWASGRRDQQDIQRWVN